MLRASNNDILKAVAETINCRDSRRGRKPSWNILITTSDSGTVRIIDLACEGCSRIVGKRSYNRKATPTVKRKYTKRVKAIGVSDVIDSVQTSTSSTGSVQFPAAASVADATSDVRISPITGKPVRKYTKRSERGGTVADHNRNAADTERITKKEQSEVAEKTYEQDVTDCLANLRIDVEKAKLAKEMAHLKNDAKTMKVLDTVIAGLESKCKEMEAKLAVIGK